jgi:hypothetical protein
MFERVEEATTEKSRLEDILVHLIVASKNCP